MRSRVLRRDIESQRLSSKVLILDIYLLINELETLLFLLLLLKFHHDLFQLLLRPFVNIQIISMPLLRQEELFKVLVAKTLVDNFLNQESLFCHAGYPKLVFIRFFRFLNLVLIGDIICLITVDTTSIQVLHLYILNMPNIFYRIVHDSFCVIVVSIVDWIKVLINLSF